MSERMHQARAEGWRRYPHHGEDIGDAYGYGHFMDGWLAADANPKPRAITHDDMGAAYAVFMDAEGHPVRRFIVALKALGIEVEGDDE